MSDNMDEPIDQTVIVDDLEESANTEAAKFYLWSQHRLANRARSEADSQLITITFGAQTFSPVPFNSFTVGPYTFQTIPKRGETLQDAVERANNFLLEVARKDYEAKKKLYYERLGR